MSSSSTIQLPRIKFVRAFCGKPPAAAADSSLTPTSKNTSTQQGADYHDVDDLHWINGCAPHFPPIANPMSIHGEQYINSRKSWGINAIGSLVVEVEAEDGTRGVGVSIGGAPACYLVENHLSRFVEGQNPSSVELIHDQMMRATLNYGRKGIAIQAISAVDLAVWDVLGKLRKCPVYELLGGPVRQALPVYITTCRPDIAKELGFVGAKIPCPHGPAEGDVGLKKNVEFFKNWREKVGDDFPLALDCYMALDVRYTISLAHALQPYKPKWIEEFLPPDDYSGLKEVRQRVPQNQLLSTGEHEYTLKGFQILMDQGAIDIIQPDLNWCGGLTEYKKIVALAAARGVIVIPHGSSVFSYHAQLSSMNTPIAEFINLHPTGEGVRSFLNGLLDDEPLPVNGAIRIEQLRDRAGFGVTLSEKTKEDKLIRPYARSEADSANNFDKNVKFTSGSDHLFADGKKLVFPF